MTFSATLTRNWTHIAHKLFCAVRDALVSLLRISDVSASASLSTSSPNAAISSASAQSVVSDGAADANLSDS